MDAKKHKPQPRTVLGPCAPFSGMVHPPGDKSLSHRALMMAALAEGTSTVRGLLWADDIRATWSCLMAMGIAMERDPSGRVVVHGQGPRGLVPTTSPLPCGNSGTTMRLLTGMVASAHHGGILVGDASLQRRPMARLVSPLKAMGADITLTPENTAPIVLRQTPPLKACAHTLQIASGQLKGALLLAGLQAHGTTELMGALQGRDHTERLLPAFGGVLNVQPHKITLVGPQTLRGADVSIPADLSAAAFWLAAAALTPHSKVVCPNVGFNPTRQGFARLLKRMGADLHIEPGPYLGLEPTARLTLRHRPLKGANITPEDVPSLIDEMPLVALIATQAHGRTQVTGASELRVKESDRLMALADGLRALGAKIELEEDGFMIEGPQRLTGARLSSANDHRIAMMLAIAARIADGPSEIDDIRCVDVSYPQFFETFDALTSAPLAPDKPA